MGKLLTVAVAAMILAVCVSSCNDRTADDSEAIAPLAVFGVGVLTGIGVTYVVTHWDDWFGSSTSSPGSSMPSPTDPPAVIEDYHRTEAERTRDVLLRTSQISSAYMGIDSDMWFLTNSYWQRCTELSAASEWAPGGAFDADGALFDAEAFANMAALQYDWQAVLEKAYWSERNVRSLWAASSYNISAGWIGFGEGTGQLYPDFVTYCVPTETANRVYVDSDCPEDALEPTTYVVYVTGGPGSMTYQDGTVYTLSQGRNDIRGLPTGLYTLSAGCGYAGPFVPTSSGPDLVGAAALVDSGDFVLVMPNGDEMTVVTSYGGVSSIPQAGYTICYGEDDTVLTVSLNEVIGAWDGLVREFETTVQRCTLAGSTSWAVFDTLGESSQLVSVSAIMPNTSNLDMTAEQIYALSMLAMIEMSEWYDRNSSQMSADDLYISAESLDLVCHGRILSVDGSVVADDVIFTPFNYVRNLLVSSVTQWDQPGIAVVWASGPMSEWDGTSDSESMRLVTLSEGFTLKIDSMTYKGEPVQNMTLQVRQMEKVLTPYFNDHSDPLSLPDFADWSIYAKLLFVLVGAAVLFVGYRLRNPWVAVIGLAAAVLGWFFGGNIANLLYDWFGVGR